MFFHEKTIFYYEYLFFSYKNVKMKFRVITYIVYNVLNNKFLQ